MKYKCMFAAIALSVLLTGCECRHEHWKKADCVNPKICSECGEKKGEPLGHKWNKADCENPRTCSVCGETDGEPLGHKWNEADCENPRTCSVCGETGGSPVGHMWKSAYCETPKTCRICNKTDGVPAGHKWKEADCKTPKTCTACGRSTGTVAEHKVVEATEKYPAHCVVCHKIFGKSLSSPEPTDEQSDDKSIITGLRNGMSSEEVFSILGTDYVYSAAGLDNTTNYTYQLDSVPLFGVGIPAVVVVEFSEKDILFNYCYHFGAECINEETFFYNYSRAELSDEFEKIYNKLTEWYGEAEEGTNYSMDGVLRESSWNGTPCGDLWMIFGMNLWSESSGINEILLSCCDESLRK